MTNNGLVDFDSETKRLLIRDGLHIIETANAENGHLGDIISRLKTTISSIELKIEKIQKEFESQKRNKV